MDIYSHFSCYTELPILIDDILDQAKECGGADEYTLHPLSMDPDILQGMAWKYAEDGVTKAQIIYCNDIDDWNWLRLVICKEVLHTLESEAVTATSESAVTHLIDNIVVPPQLQTMLRSTLEDHVGLLRALTILIPRDALPRLRKMHFEENHSIDEIAQFVEVPPAYVSLALSDEWGDMVEQIE